MYAVKATPSLILFSSDHFADVFTCVVSSLECKSGEKTEDRLGLYAQPPRGNAAGFRVRVGNFVVLPTVKVDLSTSGSAYTSRDRTLSWP
jgi:hypothetical protein